MIRLREIAVVRTGYPFRKRPERVEQGGCLLVQMKDLDASSGLLKSNLERIEAPWDAAHQQLRAGDVLMAARGARNGAAAFLPTSDDTTLPASHLMVLRPKSFVLPEYLTWFLNLPETQEQLGAQRSGSTIPFISVTALSDLVVPLPPLETQKRIVEIYTLWVKEQALLEKIAEQRRLLVDGHLKKAIRSEAVS